MEEHEAEVYFMGALPKTRSGKMLRRTVQDIAEQSDPRDARP
jgi:acyl-coenzyme A synthetase/AMP-(fatty) acid ligase